MRRAFIILLLLPLLILSVTAQERELRDRSNASWVDEAMMWGNLGWAYYLKGELDSAVSATERCLELDTTQAWAWGKMGLYMLASGEIVRMKAAFARAARHIQERKTWDAIRDDLDHYCMVPGRYGCTEAREMLDSARRAWIASSEDRRCADLNTRAEEIYNSGDYAQAIEVGRRAVDCAREYLGSEHPEYVVSLNNLGVLYETVGQYAEAEVLYLETKDARHKLLGRNHPDYATSLNNLAGLYRTLGRYTEAEALFLEAREIRSTRLGSDHLDYATSLNNLAGLYDVMGRYAEAETLFLEAMEIRLERLGHDHLDVAGSLNNLAGLYESTGRYAEAEPLYVESVGIRQRLLGHDHPLYARSLNNLGALYLVMGRYGQAEPMLTEARTIRQNQLGRDHPEYAVSCSNLGFLYQVTGRYAKAESLYREARETLGACFGRDHPDYATALNTLAGLYELMDRNAEAESLYLESRKIRLTRLGREHPDYATSLNDLAVLYTRMGRYGEAGTLYEEAKEIFEHTMPDHPNYTKSLGNLALVYRNMGRLAEAESLYREAGDIIERTVDKNFSGLGEKERDEYFSTLESTLEVQTGYYAVHMRENATALCTMLDRRLAMKGRLFSASILQWQMARSAAAQHTAAQDTAVRSPLSPFDHQHARGKVRWQDVRAVLAPNEAAVELIRFRLFTDRWTDTVYYAALITTNRSLDRPRLVLLTNGNQLEEEGAKLHQAATRRDAPVRVRQRGYRMFWQAIDSVLGAVRIVYLSPDGVYNQINPEVFLDTEGRALHEKYDIRVLQSTRDLVLAGRIDRGKTLHSAILVGDPNFDLDETRRAQIAQQYPAGRMRRGVLPEQDSRGGGHNWARLFGTLTETENIRQVLDARDWTVELLTGDEAVKEAVLSVRHPGILHLATHGEFLADRKIDAKFKSGTMSLAEVHSISSDPLLRACLILAGANSAARSEEGRQEGRGYLTARDVLAMDLEGTQLVVLSACETGLGMQRSGEGVYGLQRALMLAGARNVLMSLWKVDDTATALLTERFYHYWLDGESLHTALNKAKSEVRMQYPEPFYWAAFILVER